MRIRGSRLREVVAEFGLDHLLKGDDPLFEDIRFYPIYPGGKLLYACWECGYANSVTRLEMGGGLCGGCSKFLFDPRSGD
jgi:hypothetical protein